MQIKKSTDNYISILIEALIAWCAPLGAQNSLNFCQLRLSAQHTEKQQVGS